MPRPATRAQRLLQRIVIRLSGGRRLTVTLRPRPRISRALLALLAPLFAQPVLALDPAALPTGGQVVAGQAGIQYDTNNLTVNQTSNKAILNWQSFDIGSAASVRFNQPGSNSVALNRVLGNDASQIHGKLSANGQVFISNSNGVLFGAGSQVDVGGLVASTLSLGDADFMQGRYQLAGDSQASVVNAGQIDAAGGVALVAATVRNDGNIQARDVALAAGSNVSLDLHGDGLLSLKVDTNALRGEVANGGVIQAGNQVIMAAATADALVGSVVNNSGIVRATGISNEGGRIRLGGGLISQTGTLDASAANGGQVEIAAHALMDAGSTLAQGTTGQGGSIRVEAQQITQTSSASMKVDGSTGGGSIHLQGGSDENGKLYSSATLSAQGTGASATGGSIAVTAASTQLRAATLDASGSNGGGTIEVGGGWQGGNAAVANARETGVNASTTLKADAKASGNGGTVVVWSDERTTFTGHISATGGSQSGNGGKLEVSGKEHLTFAGTVDTASPFGLGGSLLLDPKNITISDAAGLFDVLNLDDPNAGAGNLFGYHAVEVGNGNIAVTAYGSDIGGITNTGAAYLFDGQSGALISALYGSNANDQVGSYGITALSNGHYVVRSTNWDGNKGAVTWGNGTTGISGTVSAANSLAGGNANDYVGNYGITALSNGHYVVNSYGWDYGKGAITWGNGTTGTVGEVSAANSLVGSNAGDYVGHGGITALSNGHYVVSSVNWDGDKGAVTWGNGDTGIIGTISAANSLVGSNANNWVGFGGITALSNGHYVVRSDYWDGYKGAVTWGNGNTGISGTVSAANSLVGSNANDVVGIGGITVLSNGHYVVSSPSWDGSKGAVTWGNGNTGIVGTVSAANSLVGSNLTNRVGNSGITALSNGHYVVSSSNWDGNKGAVTWGNGTTGTTGEVSDSNSLVGSTANDRIGSTITVLSNGNYVASSYNWNDGKGAVTWGNGNGGTVGIVSSSNSLVGSTNGDRIGQLITFDHQGSFEYGNYVTHFGVLTLTNGNYVIASPDWDGNKGAVTWGSGTGGTVGTVNSSNSLVGSNAGDKVGLGEIIALSNGHYVVGSHVWNGNQGAVTWGNGTTGTVGEVSAANSLVGSNAGDYVGHGHITALSNGNYVISSRSWGGGKGAVTWGNGTGGTVGEVSDSNSLVGSNVGDGVGSGGNITALSNGNYVINSLRWNDYRGAVTWADGNTGITGIVSAANSLIGTNTNDRVAGYGAIALSNGHYIVRSSNWNGNLGAVTWGNGTGGTIGEVSASNSLVGSIAGDRIGINGITELSDSRILVRSPYQTINGLNTGRVSLVDFQPGLGGSSFNYSPAADLGINTQRLAAILNAGTAVTLQANNDIFFNSALSLDNPNGNGGHLTLQAGRNITFNARLDTDNGDLTAVAGDPGAVAAQREAGTPTITLANGITLNVGSGNATLAAIGGNVINNAGAGAIQTSGAGRYLIYSSNPTDTIEGLAGYNKRYNQGFTLGSVPAYADSGNWFFYSIAPVLTVTPNASSQTYGDLSLASLGYGLSGFIDGDDATAAGISGSATFTSDATTGSGVGSYNLAYASGLLSALGYTFTDAAASTGELSITQRLITLAATAASKIYGNVDPTLGVTVSSGTLASFDSLTDVTGTLSRETGENVGTYDITLGSGLKAGNYSITFDADNNAVTITPRSVTLAATATSKVYGETDPSLGVTISTGTLASGDSLADITGTLSREAGENVGSYDITLGSGLKAGNYSITFNADNNAISITPRSITLAATAASKIYGNLDPTLGVTVSAGSLGNGDNLTDITGALSRETGENVGTYDLTLGTGLKAGNYSITFDADNNAISITPRAVTLTATAASKIYGEADPTLGVTVSTGTLATGDSLTDITGTLSRETGENVGSYDLTLGTGLKAGNYSITFDADNNAISITPRAVTLTANAASKIYGEADPTLGVTVSTGILATGDSLADVTGTLTRETGENVGTYDLTLGSGLKAGNYSITFDADNNAISITPRALQVRANDAQRNVNDSNPGFTATITGWAFDDTPSVLLGSLDFTTDATAQSPAGHYSITPFGLSAANYQLHFIDGQLRIVAVAPPSANDSIQLVAQETGAQLGQVLNPANHPYPQADQPPLPGGLPQWLGWIEQKLKLWNAGSAKQQADVPNSAGPQERAALGNELLASNDEDRDRLGGLIIRNAGIRLP